MKKIILALICFMLLTFTGCNTNIDGNSSLPETPTLKVASTTEDILVEKGGYKWTGKVSLFKTQSVVVDAASPNQMADKMDGNKITPQSQLELKFSKKPTKITIADWSKFKDYSFKFDDNKLIIPLQEGTYIYEIIGEWPEGQVSYTIKLIVSN